MPRKNVMEEIREETGAEFMNPHEEERPTDPMNELVPVRLFKDNNKYKEDVFVMVNGKTFMIKRGVEVMVPRYVKEVLDNSRNQDGEASMLIEQLSNLIAQEQDRESRKGNA